MKRLEFAKKLGQSHMELSRYRAVCCQIIRTYCELLKDVARVDDISEIFDKLYLVFENFKIERH